MIRVAAAYAAIAWLVVQVAETLLPVFDVAPGVLRIVVVLAAIGFIPAVVIAWLFELTPEGLQRDEGAEVDAQFSRQAHQRLNLVILLTLSVAVVYFAIDKFVFSNDAGDPTTKEVSIAVMPFVNLSDSEEMAFFSDGVAEDILGLLTRTQGLRCIARSSSFALRDPDLSAAEIGESLGVEYVLTGTLRRQTDVIRISVRLVEAGSETLVWSQNYDRDLDDVFEIQDDISRQVVDAVAPTLTALLPSAQVESTEQYVAYLRARHVYLKGRNDADSDRVLEAQRLFEDILKNSPEYARAHAGMADVWSTLAIIGAVPENEGYVHAKASALRALEIDPESAEAWYALGDIRTEYDWDLPAAKLAYDRARSLAPRDADGLRGYAYFLRQAGRTDEAVAAYREALLIDPISRRAMQGLYITFVNGGRYEELESLIEEGLKRNPALPVEALWVPVYAIRQEFDRLDAALPQFNQIVDSPLAILYSAMAKRGLGDAESGDTMILRVLDVPPPEVPSNFIVASYFAAFSDFDRALKHLDDAVDAKEIGLGEALTAPLLRELRKEPQFWEWVDRAGIKPLE